MISPIQDRVLVKPAVVELSSVIFVQNTDKYNQGTVVAVGPGKIDKFGRRKPLDAKPGDTIRYGNGTYLDWPIVEYESEKYQIIQEADICWIEQATEQ